MPRTEAWTPATSDQRLERLESLESIRQLPHRYALAFDTRNFEDMVELFVDDVQVGREQRGRDALKTWFEGVGSKMADSIHFVGNHVIDLDSPEAAHGVVTCHDQLEMGREWNTGYIQYWDDYARRGGRWYFKRRRMFRWYMVDTLTRPSHGTDNHAGRNSVAAKVLPDAWPSWGEFWKSRGKAPR